VTVPVRGLGLVIAAVAVCVAAYGLWSARQRPRLFSWSGAATTRLPAQLRMRQRVPGPGFCPSGAEVMIDNRIISSRTPVSTVELSPGTHEVKLRPSWVNGRSVSAAG
jgi:hypothetical protein